MSAAQAAARDSSRGDLAMRTAVRRLENIAAVVGELDPALAQAFMQRVEHELQGSMQRYLAMTPEEQIASNAERLARVRDRAVAAVAAPDIPTGEPGSKQALVHELVESERRHGLLWLIDGPAPANAGRGR